MKSTLLAVLLFIFCLAQLYAQDPKGQFRIRKDQFIQIGYTTHKALTFGKGTGKENNGNFAIEYYNGGLNFWKPFPTKNAGNFLMYIRDDGHVGLGNTGNSTDRLWVSGDIRANAINTISDERLEKNVKNIQQGLSELLLLKPYQYTFIQTKINKDSLNAKSINDQKETKVDCDLDDKLHFGFSAQEIRKKFPNLVSKDNNGILAINYLEMIPLLIKCIQEQNEKIVELEKMVAILNKK